MQQTNLEKKDEKTCQSSAIEREKSVLFETRHFVKGEIWVGVLDSMKPKHIAHTRFTVLNNRQDAKKTGRTENEEARKMQCNLIYRSKERVWAIDSPIKPKNISTQQS